MHLGKCEAQLFHVCQRMHALHPHYYALFIGVYTSFWRKQVPSNTSRHCLTRDFYRYYWKVCIRFPEPKVLCKNMTIFWAWNPGVVWITDNIWSRITDSPPCIENVLVWIWAECANVSKRLFLFFILLHQDGLCWTTGTLTPHQATDFLNLGRGAANC